MPRPRGSIPDHALAARAHAASTRALASVPASLVPLITAGYRPPARRADISPVQPAQTSHPAPTPADAGSASRAVLGAALPLALSFIALLGYLPHLLSPLRLNFDAVLLLRMADAFRAGRGWNPPDVGSQHPIGYPALVVVLDALGVAGQTAFAMINMLSLALGCLAAAVIMPTFCPALARWRWWIAAATPWSWIAVKHASLPLSDLPYFAISMLALLAMHRAWDGHPRPGRPSASRNRAAWLIIALALTAAAILTRTIGIALLPALALAALGRAPVDSARDAILARPARFLATLAVATLAVAAAFVLVSRTTYWTGFVKQYQGDGILATLAATAHFRLLDLGQAVANIPAAAAPSLALPALAVVGAIAYAAILLGLWRLRHTLSPTLIYFVAYSCIVLIWPFADPRFWLPVLPLTLAIAIVGLAPGPARAPARLRQAAFVAGTAFVAIGAAALAVTARVSLSGPDFPSRYASGAYRDTYLAAFGRPHDPAKVVPEVLRLLQRLERRCTAPEAPPPPAPPSPRADVGPLRPSYFALVGCLGAGPLLPTGNNAPMRSVTSIVVAPAGTGAPAS